MLEKNALWARHVCNDGYDSVGTLKCFIEYLKNNTTMLNWTNMFILFLNLLIELRMYVTNWHIDN